MFTGIVTACGTVSRVARDDDRVAMTIDAPYEGLEIGESVAVDGACLTIVDRGDGWFRVEAIVTTRGRTQFGSVEPGQRVNLERAMQVGDRFGGHIVQGHVDGVGRVRSVTPIQDAVLVDIEVPAEVGRLCIRHGSITVNGASMTVNALPEQDVVQISLIPYTLEHTTLGTLGAGDRVHLEADVIGKYVERLLAERSGDST